MRHTLTKIATACALLGLPAAAQADPISLIAIGANLGFTGTAALDFVELTPQSSVVHIGNHRKVQNHIGGVHAAAMALVAETATGMVVGMNVRDDCLPLCKTLRVKFRKRATGALTAVATLEPEQRQLMHETDKGEVIVAVQVTDEAGEQPIECEFVWAWVPKKT